MHGRLIGEYGFGQKTEGWKTICGPRFGLENAVELKLWEQWCYAGNWTQF
jgi:hypothetical protein